MPRRAIISGAIFALYIGVIVAATTTKTPAAWGLNHFAFLSPTGTAIIAGLFFCSAILILLVSRDRLLCALESAHDLIWANTKFSLPLIVVVLVVFFYLLRIQTYFLGDGYTWLSIFGGGEGYIPKWSEFGAIQLLRAVQKILGGYTEPTALSAFRILSILSGGIFVVGAFYCLKWLTDNKLIRVLGFLILVGGGETLLFFGYVEFYHLSWAAAIFFIAFAVRTATTGRGGLITTLLFLLSLFIHVQTIYFLPALLWLLIVTYAPINQRRIWYSLLLALCLAGAVIGVHLIRTRLNMEVLFLPLFHGRPAAPDYYLFSLPHLSDILQQLLLMIPALPLLIWLTFRNFKTIGRDRIAISLLIASLGSLIFLVVFGAALTRARDWDLFSLCLLAPLLLLVRRLPFNRIGTPVREASLAALLTLTMTAGFLTADINVSASESRYYSILKHSESRAGWINLAAYYKRQGERDAHDRIMSEMNERYPGYRELQKGYAYIKRGEPSKALPIALKLVESDPYEREYLKLAGSACYRLGEYTRSEKYYERALELAPYLSTLQNEIGQLYLQEGKYTRALEMFKKARHLSPDKTFIAEGLGLAYYRLNFYDSTLAVADSLFNGDPNSPGGHLLEMVVAISTGNNDRARYHYNQFLRYGTSRSDYTTIRDSYAYLLK